MVNTTALKKALTIDHIRAIFVRLGVSLPPKNIAEGQYAFPTRCHNSPEDSTNFKLYYYENTQLFYCYTQCAKSFDIFDLVKNALGISFPEALQFVLEIVGVQDSDNQFIQENIERVEDWDFIKHFNQNKISKNTKLVPYNINVLKTFSYGINPWQREHINQETIKKFNIGYYVGQERITIPHFDSMGNLVGVRGRATRQEDLDAGRKYIPVTVENTLLTHPVSFNLYGLWENKNAISKSNQAIIFESEKSVLQCNSYWSDYNCSLAVCGMNISKHQRDLLLNTCDVSEVIIAFDKEYKTYPSEEYRKYIKKMYEVARKFTPYVKTFFLLDEYNLIKYKNSPSDLGAEALEKLLQHKIEVKTQKVEG